MTDVNRPNEALFTKRIRQIWADVDLGTELAPHEQGSFFNLLRKTGLNATDILEIGAGDCRMIRLLQSAGVSGRFVAVDLVNRPPQAPALPVVADCRRLPFADESFDLVYSLGVVEHFPETRLAIAEHGRVARNGGSVIITTPHLSPQTLLRWLVFLKNRRYCLGTFEEVLGRNLTLRYIKTLAENAGLDVKVCVAIGSVLTAPPNLAVVLGRLLPADRFGSFLAVHAVKRDRPPGERRV